MMLLERYIKEYVEIVADLLDTKSEDLNDKLKIKKDVIYIRKELLFEYFSKNSYEKNADKLSIWGEFNLIDRDPDSLSKKVYVGDNKRARMIVINIKKFKVISELLKKHVQIESYNFESGGDLY